MEITYDSPYIYIENPADEARILSKFCDDKNNRLVFLEIYSEDNVLGFFNTNINRISILEETVTVKDQNERMTIFASPISLMDIRDTLKVYPWDFSAVVLEKSNPLRLVYHIRGYETEDGFGLSIKEFHIGSFTADILPRITQLYPK